MLEVEKRCLLKNEKEFSEMRKYLDNNANFLGEKDMRSYLFRVPKYLRIRLVEGRSKAVITEKIGEYTDAAREEKEREISLGKLPAFIEEIKSKGYEKCSEVHTLRYSYKLDGLNVELNRIDNLGLMLEVEALTRSRKYVPLLEERIRKMIAKLGLKELEPEKYQEMLNKMYALTLKSISEHKIIQ